MKRTKHTAEQIVEKLCRADVAIDIGQKVLEVCKAFGITEQTYYPSLASFLNCFYPMPYSQTVGVRASSSGEKALTNE